MFKPSESHKTAWRVRRTIAALMLWRKTGGELAVAREAIEELSRYLKEKWGADMGDIDSVLIGLEYIDAQIYNSTDVMYTDSTEVPHVPAVLAPVVAWLDEIAASSKRN